VEAFETSDREFHRSITDAEHHQLRIDGARRATEMLEVGDSLGHALRAGGFFTVPEHSELDDVFKSTKLVINHWQCQDTPGYSPQYVTKDGLIWVYGDAGSWSGPHGQMLSPSDVARYWLDTKSRTR